MGTTPGRWSAAPPIAASAALSMVFIARTVIVVSGTRVFTLFDDAMISMRYARNLASGYGLVWNAGQPPVEGYTNFGWTLWMALLHRLPVAEEKRALLVMLSGALILAANVAVIARVAARLAPESPRAPRLAAWFATLYYPLIYWTLRGMEVGLVTLILSGSVLLALDLRDRWRTRDLCFLAALTAAGVLTRPDVVVPCGVVAAFTLWSVAPARRWQVTVVLGCALAGTLALHTGFRVWYYGAPLPNTYYLKVSGAPLTARLSRGLRGLLGVWTLHLLVPVFLAIGYLVALARGRRPMQAAGLLATLTVAACAYSAYVGGDAWDSMLYANRYITPAVPLLLTLAALGLDVFVAGRQPQRFVPLAIAALFVAATMLTTIGPIVTHGLAATRADAALRMARAALIAAPVVALPFVARRRDAVLALLGLSTVVATNGLAYVLWLNHNAFFVDDDAWATRYGMALRRGTSDDATIAVTWAGAIPYFSHRSTIDLLGKSDPIIAAAPRRVSAGFEPGHDKWDYDYSIGRLQPDLVAQLWHSSDGDRAAIERAGYVAVAPWVFARADSGRVDRAAVRGIACAILHDDPFVLGSTTRTLADDGAVARYCRE